MRDFDTIAKKLKNKDIALIGNSTAVLGSRFNVDKHEIIIRMNSAWNLPEEMKKSVGSKVDLLCVSGHKKEIDQITDTVPHVVWMSPKSRDLISEKTREKLFFYPDQWWQELYKIIGSRPSTGCMAAHMITKIIDKGHLTLYGFDFFKKTSWHQENSVLKKLRLRLGLKVHTNPHDGEKEANYICNCLPSPQLTVVKPE